MYDLTDADEKPNRFEEPPGRVVHVKRRIKRSQLNEEENESTQLYYNCSIYRPYLEAHRTTLYTLQLANIKSSNRIIMKIVAFLAVVHILLLSSAAEGRRHNFRGAEDERELKKKKSKNWSGSAAGGGNRVAPACMMAVPPNCVTWPLDEEAVNR